MNITLIDLRNNPDLLRAMEAAARRERARYIGGLLGNTLARLFRREPTHAAGAHFAR